MQRRIGRPMKYKKFLLILEDDQVYTPAAIVRNGETRGLLGSQLEGEALQRARLRIRHTLSRFSKNHFFPRRGDGLVELEGQSPTPGWLGSRWKAEID